MNDIILKIDHIQKFYGNEGLILKLNQMKLEPQQY